MRHLFLYIIALISYTTLAQDVNIPDANFKAFLVADPSINQNSDSEIQTYEADSYQQPINCSGLSITDLTGIEAFKMLRYLDCSNNSITTIDFSANDSLTNIDCSHNSLTRLDFYSNNSILQNLNCSYNSQTDLDCSFINSLKILDCSNNSISNLYLVNFNNDNTVLEELICNNNSLTSLSLNKHPLLEVLTCSNNSFSSLNLSTNTNLEQLTAGGCSMSSINLSNNPSLFWLDLSRNTFSDLNVSSCIALRDVFLSTNSFTSLSFVNNNAVQQILCSHNPSLSSITLPPSNTSLKSLWIHNNALSSLDVSENTGIESLLCYDNSLTKLDVSKNVNLDNLQCNNNNIDSLDVSNNPLLGRLNCKYSNLSYLNLKNGNNKILSLSTQNNSDLTCIQVDTISWSEANWTTAGGHIDAIANFDTLCTTLVRQLTVEGAEGKASIDTLYGTLQILANPLPTYAEDTTYTWSVTNGTGSATINSTGLLTAETDGTVTVTATANDASSTTDSLIITITHQTILIDSISIAGENGVSTIEEDNGTLQIIATIFPDSATNQNITWSVVNGTGSATISNTGLLTAEMDGIVNVVATTNDTTPTTDTLTITLTNQIILVDSISIIGENNISTIDVDNGTLQILATLFPDSATTKKVIWSVVNGTGSATIDSTGLLTAEMNGTVDVIATANDTSFTTDTLTITMTNQIILVDSISITGENDISTITEDNGILQLIATAFPDSATNTDVTWSVINATGSATIDNTGLLTAETNGIVNVIATANDTSFTTDTLTVTISNQIILVSSISVSGQNGVSTIEQDGGTLQLIATALPDYATNQTFSWFIDNMTRGDSDSSIATITETGLLRAISNGTVTVVASANDNSGISSRFDIIISNQKESGEELGLDDYLLSDVSIYPNPVSKILTINIEEHVLSVEIFDLLGELVQFETSKAFSVYELNSGTYLIKITTINGSITKRFIRQ